MLKVMCLVGAGPDFRGELHLWLRVLEKRKAGRAG